MFSCYLYFLVTLSYVINNNAVTDSKTKALFTLYENVQNFESRNENIVFLRKKSKKINERES